MEFKSTNGIFTVSVLDDKQNQETDKKVEVRLKSQERGVSLWDLADTIFNDLFCSTELDLQEKSIECCIFNRNGESYIPFTIDFCVSMDAVLSAIAQHWKIL